MKLSSIVITAAFALPLAFAGCRSSSAHEAMHEKIAAAAHDDAPASAGANKVGDDPAVPRLAVGTKSKCPVSGEDFTIKANTVQVTYAGKRYAFCCADCQPTFAKNPAKYAN